MSWWVQVALGVLWIVVVVGTLILSLVTAANSDFADARGFEGTLVAALSGAIFGLPGVALIIYGLRRRQTP